jgi:hypothetical protein
MMVMITAMTPSENAARRSGLGGSVFMDEVFVTYTGQTSWARQARSFPAAPIIFLTKSPCANCPTDALASAIGTAQITRLE